MYRVIACVLGERSSRKVSDVGNVGGAGSRRTGRLAERASYGALGNLVGFGEEG